MKLYRLIFMRKIVFSQSDVQGLAQWRHPCSVCRAHHLTWKLMLNLINILLGNGKYLTEDNKWTERSVYILKQPLSQTRCYRLS